MERHSTQQSSGHTDANRDDLTLYLRNGNGTHSVVAHIPPRVFINSPCIKNLFEITFPWNVPAFHRGGNHSKVTNAGAGAGPVFNSWQTAMVGIKAWLPALALRAQEPYASRKLIRLALLLCHLELSCLAWLFLMACCLRCEMMLTRMI